MTMQLNYRKTRPRAAGAEPEEVLRLIDMTKEKDIRIIEKDPNIEDYGTKFENCIVSEPPFCVSSCPFHVPLMDLFDKMGRSSFNAAFKPYRDAVCFPDIVSSLCPEYCKSGCPRKDTDSPVEMRMLERSLVAKARKKEPREMNLPKKDGKVAIIGAGPSGMAMAQRMAVRKYDVEIFEKTDRIGGHLWDLLSPGVFIADIERQLMHEEYQLHLNTEITDLGDLISQGFHSIYVATGEGGNDFGVIENAIEQEDGFKWYFRSEGDVGIFAGGSLLGHDTMHAIADGLNISHALQGWMQVQHLDYPIHSDTTRAKIVGREWDAVPAVEPTDTFENDAGEEEKVFSEDEIKAELDRCLNCQCDACMKYCDLSAFYDKWPLKIKKEIDATVMDGESLLHGKPAKRLINTCTQCGLCEEICPEGINTGQLALAARRILHRQGKMAFAMHQFFLNDMDHANGPMANIVRNAPKAIGASGSYESSKYAFFPGCQMGAADPELVTGAYSYILDHEPETGLMLGCCGVPAEWSGDPDRLDAENERIRSEWESLGKPELILACATCAKQFDKFFPDIKYHFLYDLMAKWGADFASKGDGGREFAIFDPCSTRGMDDLRDSVRSVISGAGYALEPLKRQEAHSACCSYGGQGSAANPAFAEFVRKRRIEESEDPYICYCINCRDAFIEEGKESYHILDLLLGKDPNSVPYPTWSERHHNRSVLKKKALKEFWGEDFEEMEEHKVTLVMSDEMRSKLHKEKILVEDMENVVEFCERTKRNVYDSEAGTYTGYKEMGYITFWAQYKPTDKPGVYELINAYSHRLKIELEAVWNGKKVDLDMQ